MVNENTGIDIEFSRKALPGGMPYYMILAEEKTNDKG